MKEAKPGDIYIDENEVLWKVIGTCVEPTVIVEKVEGEKIPSPDSIRRMNAQQNSPDWLIPHHIRKEGEVSGAMWNGFKRIWSKQS